MQVRVACEDVRAVQADALVIGLFEGVEVLDGPAAAVDEALGGQIAARLAGGDFLGQLGDVLTLYASAAVAAPRVVLTGLGVVDRFDADKVRAAAASGARLARKRGVRELASLVLGTQHTELQSEPAAQAVVEGAGLGLYRFTDYKSPANRDPTCTIASLTLVCSESSSLDAVEVGARAGEATVAGVSLARDLANQPSNTATPSFLADSAAQIAQRHGMRLEVWDRERIVDEGMGALASVAAGSSEPPRFIIVEHVPAEVAGTAPVVVAGKAITFDSGGISLKAGQHMGRMKFDMSGGAAVLGLLETIGRLRLPIRVVGLVAATENMPSGTATKPGDVVRALNGTMIEVLNTDAEGRLVLADALSYASRLSPAAVVDVATLTGAVVVALGHKACGLFANDDGLATALGQAAAKTGEAAWRLPTWDAYDEMLESDVADIKNTSDVRPAPAGAIFGAKFLERFVDYPWAHLDIAGMAWGAKKVPYAPQGATGFGVRLLTQWLRERVAATES